MLTINSNAPKNINDIPNLAIRIILKRLIKQGNRNLDIKAEPTLKGKSSKPALAAENPKISCR